MKKMIFAAAIAALLSASCTKEEIEIVENNNTEMVPLEVVLENELASNPETKAWIITKDLTIKWYKGDEFSVFDGVATTNGGTKFTISEGGSTTSCKLSGTISSSASGPIYFLYPYQVYTTDRGKNSTKVTYKTNTISDGVIFPVDAPYQYATEPGFVPVKSLMLVGKMPSKDSTDPVTMKTTMGFVKFKLEAGDAHPITKIEFTTQAGYSFIGGPVAIDYTGDDPKLILQGSGTGDIFSKDPTLASSQLGLAYDIVITPKNATSFPDGEYYIALPPKTYSKGIRMKFIDDMGCVAVKEGNSDLVVSRAKVKNLGTIVGDDLPWYESIDLFGLNHAVLQANWPFNEAKIANFAKNTEYTFTFGEDNDVFKLRTGNYDCGLYSATGLNTRGALKEAYIEIPGRTGKRITNVYLRVGAQNTSSGNPFIATTEPATDGKLNVLKLDGTFEWLTVGDSKDNAKINAWWSNKQYGAQKHWSNFDTDGEKNYRIYVSASGDSMRIQNLLIQYEDI